MSCYIGIDENDAWWSSKAVSIVDEGALFRLNQFIMNKRFSNIMAALKYTDHEPPIFFVNCFHEVRQMIDAFNDHYASEYMPSWLLCLNKSMNVWLNKFAPGFMSLPRKLMPLSNEYHSIADGDGLCGKFVW